MGKEGGDKRGGERKDGWMDKHKELGGRKGDKGMKGGSKER